MPWRRWRQGKPLDQMGSQEKCWNILEPAPKQFFCFNHSWMKWLVPAIWKEAMIIPVPKKWKDKKNPCSYRPISLLNCVDNCWRGWWIGISSATRKATLYVLSPTQTGYTEFRSTEDQLAYLAQNIEDAFQEKKKVLAVGFFFFFFFFQMHLTRSGKRDCPQNYWRLVCITKWTCGSSTSYLQRLPKWSLMAFSEKKTAFVKKYLKAMFCRSHTLFLVYINDILTTITKTVSNTLHTDDLVIRNASEHTTTATYRIQEAINGINKWTLDWSLEINIGKTNSTLFSLSTSKEQIKTEAERWDHVPDRHPHLPWCEAGHTIHMEATDREDGEKQSAETSLDEKAHGNYLGCRLINSDQSLHGNSTTNHGVCSHHLGDGCGFSVTCNSSLRSAEVQAALSSFGHSS